MSLHRRAKSWRSLPTYHYIEPAVVPEFGREASSAAEPKEPAPPTQKIEESAAMPKAPSTELIETKVDEDKTERSKTDEATKDARDSKSFNRSNSAEGRKKFCHNS